MNASANESAQDCAGTKKRFAPVPMLLIAGSSKILFDVRPLLTALAPEPASPSPAQGRAPGAFEELLASKARQTKEQGLSLIACLSDPWLGQLEGALVRAAQAAADELGADPAGISLNRSNASHRAFKVLESQTLGRYGLCELNGAEGLDGIALAWAQKINPDAAGHFVRLDEDGECDEALKARLERWAMHGAAEAGSEPKPGLRV